MDAGQPIKFDEDDAVMAQPEPSPVAPQLPSPAHPENDTDGDMALTMVAAKARNILNFKSIKMTSFVPLATPKFKPLHHAAT
jgi:hypothetical protein